MKLSYRIKKTLLSFLVALCVLFISGCTQPEDLPVVNIENHVVAEAKGYDGYGSMSFEIDYDSLVQSAAVSQENKVAAIQVAETYDLFSPEFDDTDSLANGDSVSVSWDVNEDALKEVESLLKVELSYSDFTYKVEGLLPVREYNPFDDLNMDTKRSVSGKGIIDFSIHCSVNGPDITWKVEHNGKNGELKNGDIVTLTIAEDIDKEAFVKKTGLLITKTTDSFEIAGLGEYAVDENFIHRLGPEEEIIFNQVIEDWVVEALNDEMAPPGTRTYEPFGYLYYFGTPETTENDDVEDLESDTDENVTTEDAVEVTPDKGMLVAIYKVYDPLVLEGYYVFVGLEGEFSFDHADVYMNGDALPTSFVYYEKETVRWTEKFGWGQNSEPMGFLYDGVAFAGHMDIQETFQYLEKTYGYKYEDMFASPQLKGILPDKSELLGAENVIEEDVE